MVLGEADKHDEAYCPSAQLSIATCLNGWTDKMYLSVLTHPLIYLSEWSTTPETQWKLAIACDNVSVNMTPITTMSLFIDSPITYKIIISVVAIYKLHIFSVDIDINMHFLSCQLQRS